MTIALNFGNNYLAAVRDLLDRISDLRVLNDRIAADSGLVAAYFADPNARTDINVTSFNDAAAAVTQLLFTFDSGSPSQKSKLFKLL